jgi:hypothetical protein
MCFTEPNGCYKTSNPFKNKEKPIFELIKEALGIGINRQKLKRL